jgi:hypothetical protein
MDKRERAPLAVPCACGTVPTIHVEPDFATWVQCMDCGVAAFAGAPELMKDKPHVVRCWNALQNYLRAASWGAAAEEVLNCACGDRAAVHSGPGSAHVSCNSCGVAALGGHDLGAVKRRWNRLQQALRAAGWDQPSVRKPDGDT